jgi:isopentenyl-diphosphate delta-isomerase
VDTTPSARATEARKSRHLDIALEDDVASHLDAGFSGVRLHHEALPECALEDIDLSARVFGHDLRAPILISSMTGGTERARAINHNLAIAAERAGVILALGSQRAALEDPSLLVTYRVRDVAPKVVLFANLGAVQFNYGVTIDDARHVVESIAADALYLHLNPLQEALQTDGDTNFRSLLPRIAALCRTLGVPVVAKSVGSGISVRTAARLLDAGVAAIDVAGAGGTSWARVEGRRSVKRSPDGATPRSKRRQRSARPFRRPRSSQAAACVPESTSRRRSRSAPRSPARGCPSSGPPHDRPMRFPKRST